MSLQFAYFAVRMDMVPIWYYDWYFQASLLRALESRGGSFRSILGFGVSVLRVLVRWQQSLRYLLAIPWRFGAWLIVCLLRPDNLLLAATVVCFSTLTARVW